MKFNGSHIPGSPFKIRVGETSQAGDPGMVSAYGAGLEGGVTGISAVYVSVCTDKVQRDSAVVLYACRSVCIYEHMDPGFLL